MKLKSIATKHSEASLFRTTTLEKYLREIKKSASLSLEEEKDLLLKARKGDIKSRDILAKANLKFVVSVAKEHQRRGVELLDLIAAGNMGLIEAIEKYDLNKDVKLISCAVWWIRAKIIEFVREAGYLVPLPLNRQNEILKAERIRDRINVETGQNFPIDVIVAMVPEIKKSYVDGSIPCTLDAISIDVQDPENEDCCLAQSLPDSVSIESQYILEEDKISVIKVLQGLPKVQEQIMTLSFGLQDGISYTPEEITKKLQISQETYKKTYKKALLTLKDNKVLLNLHNLSN